MSDPIPGMWIDDFDEVDRLVGALQRRHDVGVGVQRQTDLGVPGRLHDGPRVDALGEEQGRGRVPEVVIADVEQAVLRAADGQRE